MDFAQRLKAAGRAALIHLCICVCIALAVATLVLGIWYPYPYDVLSGGRGILLLLITVDVVCGPALTLISYNPRKSALKWRIDIAIIVLLQCLALAYGLNAAAEARPIYLAFEGNRFRVVQMRDIEAETLAGAPEALQSPGFGGPRMLGVRLAQPTDPDFPHSIQLTLKGLPPAFRPARWMPYEDQAAAVRAQLRPLSALRAKQSPKVAEIDQAVRASGLSDAQLGYLPLVKDEINDWIVLVSLQDLQPRAYAHVDGW